MAINLKVALTSNTFNFIKASSSSAENTTRNLVLFSAAMKKFPLAKLRVEFTIIKPLFVECRTAKRKWKKAFQE